MRYPCMLSVALTLLGATGVQAQISNPLQGARPRIFPVSPSLFRQIEAARARQQAQVARVPIDQLSLLNEQLRIRLASEGNLNAINNLLAGGRARMILNGQQQVNNEALRGNQPALPQPRLDRFNQVEYQLTAFATLQRTDFVNTLQLSEAQIKALQAAQTTYNAHLAEINQRAAVNLREAQNMYLELQQAVEVGLPRFLTAAQLQTWRQIVGNSFTFSYDQNTGTMLVR